MSYDQSDIETYLYDFLCKIKMEVKLKMYSMISLFCSFILMVHT